MREDILFPYCRVQKWVGEGGRPWDHTHKRKLYLRKIYFFLIEKYIEDARQDEKHVPDLLESIIQSPGLVKAELRPILFKMIQFGSKIKNIRVPTFWISEFQRFRSFRAAGQCQPSH